MYILSNRFAIAIIVTIAVIFIFFLLREILCVFFKNNQILEGQSKLQLSIDDIDRKIIDLKEQLKLKTPQ
jgi:hypothetical protein